MRWPWTPKDRGTLTFLSDGLAVLGIPPNIVLSQAAFHALQDAFKAWVDQPEPRPPLILGFPVDVVDKRR